MSDLQYSLGLETSGAVNNLKRFQSEVNGTQQQLKQTQETIKSFQAVIAGLAIGAVIRDAFLMANQMRDLSAATGIATQTLLGFGQAMAANGGTVDQSRDAISDLVKNLGEAANGSAELQNSFAKAGVGLDDLRTLSEQDILKKTIDGLSQIPDKATRTSLAFKIFGESVKGVDIEGLNSQLETFIAKSGANAAAVDAAGRANQNFANAMVEFKIQLLAALEPISQLAASLTESGKAVSDFISIILKIGAVVATFFILTKAIALLGAAIVALKVGGAALLTVFTIAVNLFRNFGAIMTQLGGIGGVVSGTFKVLRAYIGDIGAFAMKAIPGLGALAVAFEGLRGYIVSAYNTLKEFFGLSDSGAGAGRGGNDAITKQLQQRGEAVRREAEEARKVVDALEKQRAAIRETSAAYATRNSEIVDTINFEQSLIRKSEDYIAVERAREEVFKRAAQETDKLRKAKAALGPAEQALGAVYDEQIAKIAALAEADAARIAESTQGLENLKILEAARLKDIETTTKLLEDQAQRRLQIEQNVRDIILDGQDKIRQGYESLELEGLGGISKELRQIEIEEKRVAEAARRRVAEQFGDDGDMGQMSQAMKEIDQATKVVIERRQAAAAEIYEQQRSFTQGWKQAFKEYADDATNSAKAAGQIFSTVSRGMEDSIVNFAKTGKFEFKSFAATVLEELLRIQIRKTFAGLLGGGKDSSFGGFFANGGVLGAGKWGIAGEAGPEIISGPAKITPMSDLPQAAPAAPTIVTYNISAVDANSFKQMLAKDPGFLYSVSEQGRRAAPATRR